MDTLRPNPFLGKLHKTGCVYCGGKHQHGATVKTRLNMVVEAWCPMPGNISHHWPSGTKTQVEVEEPAPTKKRRK